MKAVSFNNQSMKNKIAGSIFWKTFNHPSVIIFILIGSAVIFLTFLTKDNALEIVISALASVFIGIGVNNFTTLETRLIDKKNENTKISHSIKVMKITHAKIVQMQNSVSRRDPDNIKSELNELEQIISLGMDLLKEEEEG